MNYYRLIFKKEDDKVMFSDIVPQQMDIDEFQKIKWDKPILRQEIADHVHFIALDVAYLDAMMLGIAVHQEMSGNE
jgi:hypothetical protein